MRKTLPRILALFLSIGLALPSPAFGLRNLEIGQNAAGLEALETQLKEGQPSPIAAGVEADKPDDKAKPAPEDKGKPAAGDKSKPAAGMSGRRKFLWTVLLGGVGTALLMKVMGWGPFAPVPEPAGQDLRVRENRVVSITPTRIELELLLTARLAAMVANEHLVAVPFTRAEGGTWGIRLPREGDNANGFPVRVSRSGGGLVTVSTEAGNPFQGSNAAGQRVNGRAVMLVDRAVFDAFMNLYELGQGRRPPMGAWMAAEVSGEVILIQEDGRVQTLHQLPDVPTRQDAGLEQEVRWLAEGIGIRRVGEKEELVIANSLLESAHPEQAGVKVVAQASVSVDALMLFDPPGHYVGRLPESSEEVRREVQRILEQEGAEFVVALDDSSIPAGRMAGYLPSEHPFTVLLERGEWIHYRGIVQAILRVPVAALRNRIMQFTQGSARAVMIDNQGFVALDISA